MGVSGLRDSELFELAGMKNSSPAMFTRRRRILTEARRLIGEGRPGGFNMRELSDRAGVSPNTIYNAFGSKEALLAIAVSQYFEEFQFGLEFAHGQTTLEGVLERELATTLRNLEIQPYIRAVSELFFSPTVDAKVRAALVDIAMAAYRPWLLALREERLLERGVSFDRVATGLANLLYGRALEWVAGLLEDRAFIDAKLDSALTFLAGIVRGKARTELRAMFIDLHGARLKVGLLEMGAIAAINAAKDRQRAIKK